MNGERTYTICEISAGIEGALQEAFPETIWVVGEIQGLDRSRHGKHWYFQLCESKGDGEVYRLSATIWNRVRERLFGPEGKLSGIMDLKEPLDGIKIRALCRLEFYAPYGKISLHIEDIDPAYTLGDLEARRQALIEKLTKQGVLHKNQELSLEEVPLRLGLITSEGSAAHEDFMKELEKSGIGFSIQLCDARMQGEEAIPTVRAAFAALEELSPDAIVLIRGGGSRLDLAWFDREEIVRRIVNCKRPVVTGIGHEIDVTVSEMTAHTGLKTPTAAAAFLVERVKRYLVRIHELGSSTARTAAQRIELEEMALQRIGSDIASSAVMALKEAGRFFLEAPRRFSTAVNLLLEKEGSTVTAALGKLAAGRHIRRFEDFRLDLSKNTIRLRHGWQRCYETKVHHLKLLAEQLRLLDPARILQRGYSLLRDEKGRSIKSVNLLNPSDRFRAVLRDGQITARVEEIEREDAHEQKEKRQLEIW